MIKGYSLPAVCKTMREGSKAVKRVWKMNGQWDSINDYQQALIKFLESNATLKVEKALGDALTTEVVVDSDGIELNTLLTTAFEWLGKGTLLEDLMYESVLLKSDFQVFDNGVVSISAKNGDQVYLKAGRITSVNMMDFVAQIHDLDEETSTAGISYYDELVFPCASVDDDVSMDPVLDMICGSAVVNKASQHIMFDMNEVGVKLKVEVKMRLTKSIPRPKKRFVICGPFIVWAVKANTSIPYFCLNVKKSHLTLN